MEFSGLVISAFHIQKAIALRSFACRMELEIFPINMDLLYDLKIKGSIQPESGVPIIIRFDKNLLRTPGLETTQTFRKRHTPQGILTKILMATQWLDVPLPAVFIEPADAKCGQPSARCLHNDIQIRMVIGMLERARAPACRHVFAFENGLVKLNVALELIYTGQWANRITGRSLVRFDGCSVRTSHKYF